MASNFKWTAPWEWSKQTRNLKIGKLIDVYVHPSMGGGFHATINGKQLGHTTRKPTTNFRTLREAKTAVEVEITRMVRLAYRQIEK